MNERYPELEKMLAVTKESHTLSSFLDWLEAEGMFLCEWGHRDLPVRIPDNRESLLARYFNIESEQG